MFNMYYYNENWHPMYSKLDNESLIQCFDKAYA